MMSTAKWVRTGHVTTDEHWLSKPLIPNGLKDTTVKVTH